MRTKKLTNKLFFPALLLLVFSFLFCGIFMDFAISDTYDFVWNWSTQGFINQHIRDGRPLYGLLSKLIYPNITSITELKYVRFITLVFLFSFSIYLYHLLLKHNFPKVKSMFIVILFLTTPFVGITAHWVVLCLAALALLLIIIAGDIAMAAFVYRKEINRSSFIIKLVISGILGVLVLNIYQPIYPLFILPVFLCFINQKNTKGLWYFLCFHLAIYALYFVFYKFSLDAMGLVASGRVGEGFSGKKLIWFIKGGLLMSWQHSFIFLKQNLLVAIRLITGIAILFFIVRQVKTISNNSKVEYVLTLFGFYILAYLPSFLAADTWISYRTTAGVALITTILLIMAFHEIKLPYYFSNILSALVVSFALISAFYNNYYSIAQVQSNEYNSTKNAIRENVSKGLPSSITIIAPKGDLLNRLHVVPFLVTDEFGLQSTTKSWVHTPIVKQLLYEITGQREEVNKIPITIFDNKNPVNDSLKNTSMIVDFDVILKNFYKNKKINSY